MAGLSPTMVCVGCVAWELTPSPKTIASVGHARSEIRIFQRASDGDTTAASQGKGTCSIQVMEKSMAACRYSDDTVRQPGGYLPSVPHLSPLPLAAATSGKLLVTSSNSL